MLIPMFIVIPVTTNPSRNPVKKTGRVSIVIAGTMFTMVSSVTTATDATMKRVFAFVLVQLSGSVRFSSNFRCITILE